MDAASKHCTAGIGIWAWASNDQGEEPDIVMACAGDVPTLATLAAVPLLHQHFPELKNRAINVVELMTPTARRDHPPRRLEDQLRNPARPMLRGNR